MNVVKDYQPRPSSVKTDSDNFWTLYFRKYPHVQAKYYRNNCELKKQQQRDRYKYDFEYRERCKERAKENYLRRKQLKENSSGDQR